MELKDAGKLVDLVLVHHIKDYTNKTYLFKAEPDTVEIGDIVACSDGATNPDTIERKLAIVDDIWPSVLVGGPDYQFICKVAGIKNISKYIDKIYKATEIADDEIDNVEEIADDEESHFPVEENDEPCVSLADLVPGQTIVVGNKNS